MTGLLSMAFVGAVTVKALKDHLEFNQAALPWRGMISESADRHGVSRHILAAILWKESRFDPNALGSAGEVGMGQFKEIAARDVGVDFLDLKTNSVLQVDAAAQLLRLNAERLDGDIIGSVRAYNVGIGTVQKDSAAGMGYALDVFRSAAVDWLYGVFGLRDKKSDL